MKQSIHDGHQICRSYSKETTVRELREDIVKQLRRHFRNLDWDIACVSKPEDLVLTTRKSGRADTPEDIDEGDEYVELQDGRLLADYVSRRHMDEVRISTFWKNAPEYVEGLMSEDDWFSDTPHPNYSLAPDCIPVVAETNANDAM
ncbi:hypothetical protein LTS18_001515 [Coniosporium uncinatum]|uniref:Uncharacterized protein n=1 Tax=Coniosporium uncinatum TaxID=93489 RepID=A0ACC3DUX1_9PEZI|nr:hypothetical protein LTS18_001515 [Coniosporium uncinatum]